LKRRDAETQRKIKETLERVWKIRISPRNTRKGAKKTGISFFRVLSRVSQANSLPQNRTENFAQNVGRSADWIAADFSFFVGD
jgi:hypothetical protein